MGFTIDQIEPFFLRAMEHGYASNPPESRIEELPGSKIIKFEESNLQLVDCWQTTRHSNKSFGTTTISVDGDPVWMMQYWGEYEKWTIPFLKLALRSEYNRNFIPGYDRQFFKGCRGPRTFTFNGREDMENLVYQNTPDHGSTFTNFSGKELILERAYPTPLLGWHEYHGMLLV